MLTLLILSLLHLPFTLAAGPPPASLTIANEQITVLNIGNDTNPLEFYQVQTSNDIPNIGLVTAWPRPFQHPTWFRPTQLGPGIQILASAIIRSLSRLPTDEPVKGEYLTWGPEYQQSINSLDSRITVRQYRSAEWGPDGVAERTLTNGEVRTAGVLLANMYGRGQVRTEEAWRVCYVNGSHALEWCSGVIMLQRDLWYR
ncbi:MAG: hypothetical protein Q9213_000717 [Squamulea squamosa]